MGFQESSTSSGTAMCHLFVRLGQLVNRPKFSSCATWQATASTLTTIPFPGAVGAVYVNINNTIYVPSSWGKILIWQPGDTGPSTNLTAVSSAPSSVFVSNTGEVFAGTLTTSNVSSLHRWSVNTATSTMFLNTSKLSYSLFIDDLNRLYYSLGEAFKVMRLTINDSLATNTMIAGDGYPGNASTRLFSPAGIFVTTNYSLYVADFGNNRIQLFPSGQTNATTVAGATAPGTITLAGPSAVVLDADGYVFITDRYQNRVVGQGASGFRCIVGCTSVSGSANDQFSGSMSLSFDSYGNMYVSDAGNRRVQKFLLSTNSCCKLTFPCDEKRSPRLKKSIVIVICHRRSIDG